MSTLALVDGPKSCFSVPVPFPRSGSDSLRGAGTAAFQRRRYFLHGSSFQMTAAPLQPPPVAPADGEPRDLEDRFLKVEWKASSTKEKVLIALRIRTARATFSRESLLLYSWIFSQGHVNIKLFFAAEHFQLHVVTDILPNHGVLQVIERWSKSSIHTKYDVPAQQNRTAEIAS